MDVMERSQSGWESGLTPSERTCLFQIAHDALSGCVQHPQQGLPWAVYDLTEALRTHRACFVTLHLASGALRGCIGNLEPVGPLYQAVYDNTVAAALQDPRFTPVRADELPGIDLTVSILSPSQPVAGAADFVPGEHGIIIEKKGRRAVFLPEVAAEQGWTRAETLRALCQKAGLPEQAWEADMHFSIFHTAILSGLASCGDA